MLSTGGVDVPPTLGRRLARLVGCTALFMAAGFVSRATMLQQETVSLVWAGAGVAALWLGAGSRRTWPGDVAALALASYAVNALSGADAAVALVLTVANVLQVCAFVALARSWTTGVWGLGGTEPLHRLADLGRLVGGSVVACFLGTALGWCSLVLLVDGVQGSDFLVWWGRNTVGLTVVTTFGLLVGPPLLAARNARELGRILLDSTHARTFGRLVEAELLVAASVTLYALVFGQRTAEPLSFLVLVVSVWAGLRFGPVAVVLHGVALGLAGLVFTLHGLGPFAGILDAHDRALVSQVFVATTVLTGLALAFSRVERDNATRRLAAARRDADERARLLGAVLESMHEGLIVVGDGGEVLLSNAASHQLLGTGTLEEKVRASTTGGLFRPDGTPVAEEDLPAMRALAGEDVPSTDFHLRVDAVPEGRVLEIGARPLGPQGTADRRLAVVNVRDVTLDRQHRDTLASFAGVVAHDLFNPLTLVTGWTETLEEAFAEGPVRPDEGLPMVARVREAADHMRAVIGDLLAYTVARDQSLRPEAMDLTAEVRELALLRIHGPGAPLITVAPGLAVWADRGLVRQLFDNLLGNAVKFVAPGTRPRVDVRGHRSGDWLELRVSDNGIGIPEDQREQVFESFHRGQVDGYQGSGLGLAICRRIVDRHGGSIHVETGPGGVGTTFALRLPATATVFAAPGDRPSRVPQPQRQAV